MRFTLYFFLISKPVALAFLSCLACFFSFAVIEGSFLESLLVDFPLLIIYPCSMFLIITETLCFEPLNLSGFILSLLSNNFKISLC